MEREQIERIIGFLDVAKRRPLMYFSDNAPAITTWLHGFETACIVLGLPNIRELGYYNQVVRQRGWTISSAGIWQEMQGKGWTETQIIEEMFQIYLETLKLTLKQKR